MPLYFVECIVSTRAKIMTVLKTVIKLYGPPDTDTHLFWNKLFRNKMYFWLVLPLLYNREVQMGGRVGGGAHE